MIDLGSLRLSPPSLELWRDYRAMCREFRLNKVEDFAYPRFDTVRRFNRYKTASARAALGLGLAPGAVPYSEFWLTLEPGSALGGGSVRHFLNDSLRVYGGHISYYVRPFLWGCGVGGRLLALLIDEARDLGISIARVTCFDDNIASARVIEKNGGYIIDKVNNDIKGKPRLTRIYEILI